MLFQITHLDAKYKLTFKDEIKINTHFSYIKELLCHSKVSTSKTASLTGLFTTPARQQWLIALQMICRFDLELGLTKSFGPKKE